MGRSSRRASDNPGGRYLSPLIVATHVYKFIARVHTDLAELPEVVCNVGELNQVFLNLIVNSAHAIEDPGRDIEIGAIKIRTELSGDCVVGRLSDNGCGIPPENLAKLYEPPAARRRRRSP
jgi:C4-dicarboxylate-specific signal transduction histidine kinase